MRQPCEAGRAYVTTRVSVASADGRIVDTVDRFAMSVGERAINLLYPIHTGEIGGAAGRIVVLSIGVWLATMIVLGFRLWLSRRPKQRRRKADRKSTRLNSSHYFARRMPSSAGKKKNNSKD